MLFEIIDADFCDSPANKMSGLQMVLNSMHNFSDASFHCEDQTAESALASLNKVYYNMDMGENPVALVFS